MLNRVRVRRNLPTCMRPASRADTLASLTSARHSPCSLIRRQAAQAGHTDGGRRPSCGISLPLWGLQTSSGIGDSASSCFPRRSRSANLAIHAQFWQHHILPFTFIETSAADLHFVIWAIKLSHSCCNCHTAVFHASCVMPSRATAMCFEIEKSRPTQHAGSTS
jgi:hypothetical protein